MCLPGLAERVAELVDEAVSRGAQVRRGVQTLAAPIGLAACRQSQAGYSRGTDPAVAHAIASQSVSPVFSPLPRAGLLQHMEVMASAWPRGDQRPAAPGGDRRPAAPAGGGGRAAGAAAGRRPVLRAHRAGGRHAGHAHLARGGLRPRARPPAHARPGAGAANSALMRGKPCACKRRAAAALLEPTAVKQIRVTSRACTPHAPFEVVQGCGGGSGRGAVGREVRLGLTLRGARCWRSRAAVRTARRSTWRTTAHSAWARRSSRATSGAPTPSARRSRRGGSGPCWMGLTADCFSCKPISCSISRARAGCRTCGLQPVLVTPPVRIIARSSLARLQRTGLRKSPGATVLPRVQAADSAPPPEPPPTPGAARQAGMTSINDFATTYMCQALPFGGVKDSGFDRFAGVEGLRGLCVAKAVCEDRCGCAWPDCKHWSGAGSGAGSCSRWPYCPARSGLR